MNDEAALKVQERLQGLPPVIARHSRLVILGSFPGVASLQAQQYYGHPHNQFWPLLGAIWGIDLLALPYRQRLTELRRRGLGLWDVYACAVARAAWTAPSRTPISTTWPA